MKRTNNLTKDLVTLVIAWIIATTIFSIVAGGLDLGLLIAGLILASFPFGWRWASHIITAVGPISLLIKFMMAYFLGFIAAPVTIIKDILEAKRAI